MIQVNEKTCTRCGFCAGVCPGGMIDFQAGNYPKPGPIIEMACIRCGHCVAACPTGSLTHRELPFDQFPLIRKDLKINAKQCEQFLRARRSIRAYKKQSVSRDVITRLIDIAHYAPTGHNEQNVEWLVIDNPQTLLNIEEAAIGWMTYINQNQPQMAATMNFSDMITKQQQNHNVILRGAPAVIGAYGIKDNPMTLINSSIALSYLELAATSLGLGCCWAGFLYFMSNTFPPVQQILNLPAGHTGYGFMMLGYPQYSYTRLAMRKPARISWHE